MSEDARDFPAEFASRYNGVVRIVADWVQDRIDLRQADVLDFGCGEGIAALGMAHRLGARSVLGVDIMQDVERCVEHARSHLGLEGLPANLSVQQIDPGGDFHPGRSYDLIYSWSVFEHVEQSRIAAVLESLHGKLRENGLLFIQIAPLYYSADGSHLHHRIPEPWGHLLDQQSIYFDKLCRACDDKAEVDALWSCYQWLNQVTAPALRRILEESGFRIEREYYTESPEEPPEALTEIFQRSVLKTNQLVFLCAKAV